jgi:hypothetical protein
MNKQPQIRKRTRILGSVFATVVASFGIQDSGRSEVSWTDAGQGTGRAAERRAAPRR